MFQWAMSMRVISYYITKIKIYITFLQQFSNEIQNATCIKYIFKNYFIMFLHNVNVYKNVNLALIQKGISAWMIEIDRPNALWIFIVKQIRYSFLLFFSRFYDDWESIFDEFYESCRRHHLGREGMYDMTQASNTKTFKIKTNIKLH